MRLKTVNDISDSELIDWIASPKEYISEIRNNPARFLRDKANIPTKAISPFFKNKLMVVSSIKMEKINPFISVTCSLEDWWYVNDGFNRYIHIDLAQSRNRAGICCCHASRYVPVERYDEKENKIYQESAPYIIIDYMGVVSAPVDDVIDITKFINIVENTYERGAYPALVTFDSYQSQQAISMLQNQGITAGVMSLDRTTTYLLLDGAKNLGYRKVSTDGDFAAPFDALYQCMKEHRIEIPEHNLFLDECFELEWVEEKRVVMKQPGSSDDLVQPVAGAVFNLIKNEYEYTIEDYSPLTKKEKRMIESEKDYKESWDYHEKEYLDFWVSQDGVIEK